MTNYNIADLITRINGNIHLKNNINIPYTKDIYQILTLLTKLGLLKINYVDTLKINNLAFINITFINLAELKTNKLSLISKPGKRIYTSYKSLKDFNHGHKLYILRTSKGIISSQTALKLKLGGELLIKL
jgi:small subunit ribosomal protein S8